MTACGRDRRRGRELVAALILGPVFLLALIGRVGGGDISDPSAEELPAQQGAVLREGRGVLPASFFGLHIHRGTDGRSWPGVPFATWRLWDAYTVWPWLEPARGQWNWDRLDKIVKLAGDHNVELLLPLGLSPTWASARPTEPSDCGGPGFSAEPAKWSDWRRYVEAVVARYAGRVRLFEIWNEPNLRTFYSGTVEDMVSLCREAYAIVKRSDPANLVVSPSVTTASGLRWLERFLAAGGGDCFDVVGYHFYVAPDPPEHFVPLAAEVRRVMTRHGIGNRPLWNTESGWFITSRGPTGSPPAGVGRTPLTERAAAGYLARAVILSWASGVERFYWYSWDSRTMGLMESDGTAKQPGVAFGDVQRWLVGAELNECRNLPGDTWVCSLSRAGQRQWIVWNAVRQSVFQVPSTWRAVSSWELAGARQALQHGPIAIGPLPQLIESAP